MTKLNCVRCHVPDWELKPQAHDSRDYTRCYPGDRRFFDLELRANPDSNGFAAKLQDLRTDKSGDSGQLRRSGYVIKGVYSDFAYHDLGPGFHEIQFDGTVVKMFRTAPLWGIGSSAPYGHDGASLDIDTVIRRHSGEAKAESESYAALTPDDRDALLAFLRGLVLYSVDDVPCDINGDSTISMQFKVAGQDTGVERLNPEWLFRTPGEIEGQTNAPNRKVIKSWALRNLDAAYGISLEYLSDQDHDGFPDIRQKAAK